MKWLWALALMAGLTSQAVNAAEFYENKTLAHPLIQGLQESSATLAFIKEAGGVKGYYCICDTPEASPQLLDDFGQATIESVFLMSLDSEAPTRFVLFRHKAAYKLYAYKYDTNDHLYSRVTALQKALDRITAGQKQLDALTVKKALARVTPANYRFHYQQSGIAEFDQLDLTAGTLVGYFDEQSKPLDINRPGTDQYYFKKTYQEKNGRILTVTFWRGIDTPVNDGDRRLYNYQVGRVAWETAPATFSGSEVGPSVSFNFGEISAQGAYEKGLRTGIWSFAKEYKYSASGNYVAGKRQGEWTETDYSKAYTGQYVDNVREGRWTFLDDGDSDNTTTGFQTYLHGVLDGPSEEITGTVIERGNYRNDKREGPWVTAIGSGAFENDLKSGPWTLKTDKGHSQSVNFVAGKKEGELRETDANGVLILIEHYKANVLSGTQEFYNADGKLLNLRHYENGKKEGRALDYSSDGSALINDITWHNDEREGPYLTFLRDGTPATVGRFELRRFVGSMKQYDDQEVLYEESNWCRFDKDGYPTVDRCGITRHFTHGKLSSETDFLYGDRQASTDYNYETGRKTSETIIGDNDHITDISYYDNGQIECQKNRVGFSLLKINQRQVKTYEHAGDLTGEQLCYHRNGVVKSRAFYDKGPVGCTTQYDETGKQTYPGPEGCPKPVVPVGKQKRMLNFSS
ncbi:hypothetical protein [Pseudomonas sp. NPDC087615]|uniref:toxin-antitoxin system YwqK family antitoxin n=1 Tax=Pseudomonas sp. NPDC087615 TaxID=3364443 RepID=UPI0038173672